MSLVYGPKREVRMRLTTKLARKSLIAFSSIALAASLGLAAPAAEAQAVTPPATLTVPQLVMPAKKSYPKPRITKNLVSTKVSRYGTRTSTTFVVGVKGTRLHYAWQSRSLSGGAWRTIKGAKLNRYVAKSSSWPSGAQFRVIIVGRGKKKVISRTAKLLITYPSATPAQDAARLFGLTGLRQGVDLSAYQYTPSAKVNMTAISAWGKASGFVLLRNGSGARPIYQSYTNLCTNTTLRTGSLPITEDCAYSRLADQVSAQKLSVGHYWFNGWISSNDTTKAKLFAGSYTPAKSAAQFVAWLKADGNYTTSHTDPLVLDVENGRAWTKTSGGKKYVVSLRAWNPSEAYVWLSEVKRLLTAGGYKANLYVYMSASTAARTSGGAYVWRDVAKISRLWVAYWATDNGRIPPYQPRVGPWVTYGGWSIWQYTSNLRISGSRVGALDGDIAKSNAWTPR